MPKGGKFLDGLCEKEKAWCKDMAWHGVALHWHLTGDSLIPRRIWNFETYEPFKEEKGCACEVVMP
jgi:hypothetical protein